MKCPLNGMSRRSSQSSAASRALLLSAASLLAFPLLASGQSSRDIGAQGTDGPAETSMAAGSAAVGELLMLAPAQFRFPVRGTLPLPPNTFLRAGVSPGFSLRGPDGKVWPAQTNVVTTFADESEGADVIELIAYVRRPHNVQPGDELTYEVLLGGAATGTHTLTPQVQELLRAPRSIVLRTRDVFGNEYRADLLADLQNGSGEQRTFREGTLAHQMRTYENLVPVNPVSGSTGTLPHLMGVHSYVTTWKSRDIVTLDIRLHNGHEGRDQTTDQDDPMGTIYFDGLELELPKGWEVYQAYPTPSMGDTYVDGNRRVVELVEPLASGQLHVMPSQGQFHRRLVICRKPVRKLARLMLSEGNLAFCRGGRNSADELLWSWWNPETSRYWAQNLPLPDMAYLETRDSIRLILDGEYSELHDALTNGTPGPWPVVSPMLGWAHPFGYQTGGAVGGAGIFFFDGVETAWSASVAGYRRFQMTHRMYSDRHPTALYQLDGDAYHMEEWVEQGSSGPYLPNYVWLIPWLSLGDPWGFGNAPTFQVDAVAQQGRQPDYESDILGYDYIDTAHLIRYTRSAKVLAWLGNDAIAKDDILLQAELCRASFTELPQGPNGQSISTGLLQDLQHAEQYPNDGIWIDRGEGWEIDTVANAYALQGTAWRADARPWMDSVVKLLVKGQSNCIGGIMSLPGTNHFNGQYRFLQSISECILQNAIWGARSSVYDGVSNQRYNQLGEVIRTSAYAMISDQIWNSGGNTANFYTALGPFDRSLPSFCTYVPPDGHEGYDGWQIWNMFVFGFELTGDVQFLHRAADLAGGVLTPESMGQNQHPGELETRAGMISFLQTVLGF